MFAVEGVREASTANVMQIDRWVIDRGFAVCPNLGGVQPQASKDERTGKGK